MDSSTPRPLTFGQLSVGLQILLILILVGSCSGASNNAVTDRGVDAGEVQQLRDEISTLSREVRRLRRELDPGR